MSEHLKDCWYELMHRIQRSDPGTNFTRNELLSMMRDIQTPAEKT